MSGIVACDTCGLVQSVEPLSRGGVAKCARCDFVVQKRKPNSRTRTAALALAAFVLFWPANLLPIVSTTYWGKRQTTTIFDGIQTLFEHGSYAIATLVFVTSILSPALKILGLLFLSLTDSARRSRRFRAWTYKIIEIIGPWNMLEVFLLSIAVAIAELGKVATVEPGPGVFSFAALVVLTLLATHTFDPRLIWQEPAGRNDEP